jgi:polyhydroxyalkanoate synthesis regulator phasin
MKKTAGTKPRTSQVFSRLQDNMRQLRRDAQALMIRTRKQATSLITRDQRRALDRLLRQAQRLRTDLEKRAQRASKDVEARTEHVLSTLEQQVSKRLRPILRRLDVPSRHEVHSLSRRIAQLEVRMKSSLKATPKGSPRPSRAKTVATSAGK